MTKKFILAFVFLLLISSVSANATYYSERTSSTSSDGSSYDHEVTFRGSIPPTYSDDYDRYYDRETRKCSSRDARRSYINRYYGRGYDSDCYSRYYYRPARYTTIYNRDYESPRYYTTPTNERASTYDYRGRTMTRTSRY